MTAFPRNRIVVVIPVYNHPHVLADVVSRTRRMGFPVIVVDDGSTDRTGEILKSIKGIVTLRHRANRGKGAALLTGFTRAAKTADWAITLDADGQHHPEDIPKLITAIPPEKRPIIIGYRQNMKAANAPWTSRFGRRFSTFWMTAAGGPAIRDSQSGFRLYPLPEAIRLNTRSRRFQFEVEILIQAHRRHIPVMEHPVSVTYLPGLRRISHYHKFFDFLRNTGMFSRMIFCRIICKPE